eukprot:365417-Chlamydomonas_euryale.AAC.5
MGGAGREESGPVVGAGATSRPRWGMSRGRGRQGRIRTSRWRRCDEQVPLGNEQWEGPAEKNQDQSSAQVRRAGPFGE